MNAFQFFGYRFIACACVVGANAACGAAETGGSEVAGDTMVEADDAAVGDTGAATDTSAASDTSATDTTATDTTATGETTNVASSAWFTQTMAWEVPVADLPPHPRSDAMIAALAERGGWGNRNAFQIDFSLTVLAAAADTPMRTFTPNGDFYEGDCDQVPMPVPTGGALEGEDGYACEGDGDCHLIVRAGDTLYEMWRANIDASGVFDGGCLAVWDLERTWPEQLRGEGCTSADAAGLPIAPLTFSADEVAAGAIAHAIRFILPNSRIAHRQYVRPATHATGAASADVDGMPYGVRLRLRADFPVASLPSEGARVVARALKRYGMILADGGEIALTAASDRTTVARWDGLLDPHDLATLDVSDFAVVDMGEAFDWSGDCERTP